MKLVVIAVLATLAASAPENREHDHDIEIDHGERHENAIPMGRLYGKARKVQSSSSSFGGDEDACPIDCLTKMNSDFKANPELHQFVTRQSQPYRFENQFNSPMLTKYCQVMNRTTDCVRPCSEGQVKNIATKAMHIPKYICIETRFLEYAPCYDKVSKINDKICNGANKCGSKKTALENDMRRRHASMRDIENLIENTCEYHNCYNECDRPKLTEQCGADANRILQGLYSHSINTLIELFGQMGIQVSRPPLCSRLVASDDE